MEATGSGPGAAGGGGLDLELSGDLEVRGTDPSAPPSSGSNRGELHPHPTPVRSAAAASIHGVAGAHMRHRAVEGPPGTRRRDPEDAPARSHDGRRPLQGNDS